MLVGLEVNRSAYFPKQPRKRNGKVESDSSSDEEWLPGKDENNQKKFEPYKPGKLNEVFQQLSVKGQLFVFRLA